MAWSLAIGKREVFAGAAAFNVCSPCLQLDDDQTRGFQAASARLMGDMKEAGDAPFRGEVQLDSKVLPLDTLCGALHPLLCCVPAVPSSSAESRLLSQPHRFFD